jgi:alpha/beta superfamily hydrolase
MSESGETTHRTFEFGAFDGPRLVADLAVPAAVRGAAVICHPHPQYGGTRFDAVVSAVFDALPAAGIAALRFDFRADFGDGVGERLDALAALDELAAATDGAPLALVGYSFGAWVVLGLDDERVNALIAVAPPLSAMPVRSAPTVQTLVLTPAHDQFSAPNAVEPIIDDWRSHSEAPIDFEVVEMADHFLAGRTTAVADRTTSWLSDRWPLPSPL